MFSFKDLLFSLSLSLTFLPQYSYANMCLSSLGQESVLGSGAAVQIDLQNDPKNCGKKGRTCSQIDYCFKGKCVPLPQQSMFCAEEKKWCMVTCNDGWVVRNLCSPCKKACKSACKEHNGCKSTCSEITEVAFTKKCILA